MPADWLEQIRSDNTSGAAVLAVRAARELMARAGAFSDAWLIETARALVEAQPAMAPIFNLANRVLLAGPERVEATCHEFIRQVEAAADAIASIVAGLIPDGAVLTHSYSSTVLKALRKARQAGKRFDIICTESRPVREGVILARELAREGVPVRLIVDAAVSLFLPAARIVLVGADSVSPRGLVNKIGTSTLTLAAEASHVPVYALCSFDKFLPAGYHAPPEPPKKPNEVLEDPIPSVTAANYYFDLTPLEHLTGIITEEGVLSAADLRRRLAALPVHEALLPRPA